MIRPLARNWWLLAIRGLAAIIFGILAFVVNPLVTTLVLVTLFGVYALVEGFLLIISAIQHRTENNRWWVLLLEGLAGVAAGVVAFVLPGITAFSLLIVIAVWAIFTGVMEVISAIRLRREISNEWALGLSGVLSIVLGAIIVANPAAGLVGLIFAIAVYAVLFGVLMLYLAFRVRGYAGHVVA